MIGLFSVSSQAVSQDATISAEKPSTELKLQDIRFGTSFSLCKLLVADNVSRPSSDTSEMMVGFTFGTLLAGEDGRPWLIDIALQFGSADRYFYGYYNNGVLFSLEAFGGMNFDLGDGILFVHTLFGLNFLHIGASDSYVQQFQNDIYYYGTDGLSSLMASIFNSWNQARQVYVKGFPGHSRLAPALNFGLEIRIGEIMALMFDYTPLYDNRIRNEFRFGFAFIFDVDN
jgi:hypothetical protein